MATFAQTTLPDNPFWHPRSGAEVRHQIDARRRDYDNVLSEKYVPQNQAATMIPTLDTSRLTLQPVSDAHRLFSIALDTDPEVMRHVTGKPLTKEQAIGWYEDRLKLLVDPNHPDRGHWFGLSNATDEPIGLWMLRPCKDKPANEAEIGWRLAKEHWSQGYGTEGVKVILAFAFETLKLDTIYSDAMVVNVGSIKTMEKLGMKRRRKFSIDHGDHVDSADSEHVEYAITREEWEAAMKLDGR